LGRIVEVLWKARFPVHQPRFNWWQRSRVVDKKTGHLIPAGG
jgi:hypothetical protein